MSISHSTAAALLRAVAGPATAGLCYGLATDLPTALHLAALLPALVLGVAALMIPALYVGSALAGVAPPGRAFARAALDALDDLGVTLLGLSPALAFLVVAAQHASWSAVFELIAVATAVGLALRSLYLRLFSTPAADDDVSPPLLAHHLRALPLFGGWSLVSVGLGLRALVHVMGI